MKALSEGSTGSISKFDDAQLTAALYSLFELPALNVRMSSYDEINASGRLTLIESPKLRRLLAEYDGQHAFVMEMHHDVFQHQHIKLDPYLIENIQLSQFSEYALGGDADAGIDIPQIGPVPDIRNHRILLDDATFQNQVALKYYLIAYYREQVRVLRKVLDDVTVANNARLSEIRQ